jgi:DNA invertase Pin-like site-specific DNA recombinase
MSDERAISASHRARLAVAYLRQSTPTQLRNNPESTARQYALAEEAARLGWETAKIVVIDADLGRSGRSGTVRTGFQELVSRVCLGEVGAIFGLEVSRLARSSADLQRLLEFCSLTDTLVVDADGVYNLRQFNDRLLLGLKDVMAVAELHVLAGRLLESKRAAARRGELRLTLSIGYVYDADGHLVMDPDDTIRQAVADVFVAFATSGSAYGVVAAFAERRFPKRVSGGAWAGDVRWGRLTHGRVLRMLANPVYTGTYVYGRHQSRRIVQPDGTIRLKTVEVPREEWAVILRNHHPAYLSWETYLANQERLAQNHTAGGAHPVRTGDALLQGIVLCGTCGRGMGPVYRAGRQPVYKCSRSALDGEHPLGYPAVRAEIIDAAVARRLLEVIAPDQIALAFQAADEVEARRAGRIRAVELQLERARYEAARAERAYHQCEPENRLVARSLEQRWEAKLAALAEAEAALAAVRADTVPLPSRDILEALARDVPALWDAPTTSARDRKRVLRALIADVTLRWVPTTKAVHVGIRWRSGASEELVVQLPSHPAPVHRRTPRAAVDLIRTMAARTNEEIIAALHAAGLCRIGGQPFDVAAIHRIRHAHHILVPPFQPAPGTLPVREVAQRLELRIGRVYDWIRAGTLEVHRDPRGRMSVPFSPQIEEACRQRIARSGYPDRAIPKTVARGAV